MPLLDTEVSDEVYLCEMERGERGREGGRRRRAGGRRCVWRQLLLHSKASTVNRTVAADRSKDVEEKEAAEVEVEKKMRRRPWRMSIRRGRGGIGVGDQ